MCNLYNIVTGTFPSFGKPLVTEPTSKHSHKNLFKLLSHWLLFLFYFFTLTTNTFKLYRKQFSLTPQDSNVSRTLADFKFCLESVPCYKLEMKILSFILFLILFLIFLILLLILFFYENQNPFWSIVSFLLTVLLYIKNKTLPWFDIESYLVSGGGISIGQKSTSLLVYHFCSSRVCYTTQERTNRWRCSVHGCHNEVRLWKRHLVR